MPTDTDRIVRLEDRVQNIDKHVWVLEETTRNAMAIQKDLSETLKNLVQGISDMRVTNEGLQKSIDHINISLKEMKEQASDVSLVSNKLDAHITADKEDREEVVRRLQEHSGKFDAIKEQVKSVDDKTKLDIGKLAVQFIVFLLGGSGSFIVAMWVYINYLTKLAQP